MMTNLTLRALPNFPPQAAPHFAQADISAKHALLGGAEGSLGAVVGPVTRLPDGVGYVQHCARGSVYWTPHTGAHATRGAIRECWAAHGWEQSPLGYPLSDELPLADGHGRVQHFQHGSVLWSPHSGAHAVLGDTRDAWGALGAERGPLGYPVGDEVPLPHGAGFVTNFQHGQLARAASGGVHVSAFTPPTGRGGLLEVRRHVRGVLRVDLAAAGGVGGALVPLEARASSDHVTFLLQDRVEGLGSESVRFLAETRVNGDVMVVGDVFTPRSVRLFVPRDGRGTVALRVEDALGQAVGTLTLTLRNAPV